MGRILTKEQEIRLPHLIEYDRDNPSPKLSEAFLSYVRSIQTGLSQSELDWLNEFEYFIFNTFNGSWTEHAVPGLRPKRLSEFQYVRRYNSDDYRSMMNEFLDHIPSGLPSDLTEYGHMPVFRLTLPNGDKFYPIRYHNNIAGWRQQLAESAKLHGTLTGRFVNGKFLLSDGQTFNFSDLAVASVIMWDPYPPDW